MKDRVLFIFAFATTILGGCSTLGRPYLYVAEKDGKRAALFGTIHLGVPLSDLPDSVLQEMHGAEVAYFESSFDSYADHARMKKTDDDYEKYLLFMKYAAIPKGEPPLDQRLGAAGWKKLREKLSEFSPEILARLRPTTVLQLVGEVEMVEVSRFEAASLRSHNSMDLNLYEDAIAHSVEVGKLDDDDRVCREGEEDKALGVLRRMLATDNYEVPSENSLYVMRGLVNDYRDSEDESIRRKVLAIPGASCLLGDRNRAWVTKLDAAIQKRRRVFAAVGVGHLLGHSEKIPSLLELLKARGYSVRRIEAQK